MPATVDRGRRGGLAWAAATALGPALAADAGAVAPADPRAAALIEAAARGDVAALRRALDAGAPLDARDASGRNAVLAATQGGHVATARLLIERGADVNAQDAIEDSAFLLAGARGHTEIVRAALPRADPNLADRDGRSPLAHAVQRQQTAVAAALRAAGAR